MPDQRLKQKGVARGATSCCSTEGDDVSAWMPPFRRRRTSRGGDVLKPYKALLRRRRHLSAVVQSLGAKGQISPRSGPRKRRIGRSGLDQAQEAAQALGAL